jgi:hypothetical protein
MFNKTVEKWVNNGLRIGIFILIIIMLIKIYTPTKEIQYPDYTELIKSIEDNLNAKLDTLGNRIIEVTIKIEDNKKKEAVLIDKRKDIVKDKNETIKTLDSLSFDGRDSLRQQYFNN